MAIEKFLQGTDVTMRTFQVKDSGGTLIALASINDYRITIYTNENGVKKKILLFQKTVATETATLKQIITVDAYKMGFIIDRVQTQTLKGKYYAELEVQLTATASYISSLMNSGNDGYEVCEIVVSADPLTLT